MSEEKPRIVNPTIAQLSALALVYAAKANPVPTLLEGTLPEGWITPAGVEIVPQIGFDGLWVMQSKVDDSDVESLFKQIGM